MPVRHIIRQGDSVSRLAERHGLAPDTIWSDPANDDLRSRRGRMDVLLPGDEVVVPDLRPGEAECATGARHEFRRLGVPMLFEIQLFDERGAPAGDRAYRLVVDGGEHRGRTDADGRLREYLPNTARRGRLAVEGEPERELLFGHLDPVETLSGVQKRLTNLGFACAQDGGRMGRATAQALVAFQRVCGLPVTGELDDATREEVRACHDDPERLRAHLERPPAFGF